MLERRFLTREADDGLFAFSAGEISIAVVCHRPLATLDFPRSYDPFRISSPQAGYDLELQARFEDLPPLRPAVDRLVFDSKGLWKLFRRGSQFVYRFSSPASGHQAYRVLVLEPALDRGVIHSQHPLSDIVPEAANRLPSPLEYPLAELVMMQLLGQGRGVLVHACGIALDGQGLLFCGHSGAGKSTLSKLWRKAGLGTLLNDDRMILRCRDGIRFMYGTPWHGEVAEASSQRVPIGAIFFLRHGETNRLTALSSSTATVQLMSRIFVPHWQRSSLDYSLGFCGEMATHVPCYELAFRREVEVVDLVRRVLS